MGLIQVVDVDGDRHLVAMDPIGGKIFGVVDVDDQGRVLLEDDHLCTMCT